MLRLRPYKACDARVITKWFKDEYAFRQWSADRYGKYPITPDESNLEEIRLGFVIVDDERRGKGYGKEMLSLAIQYAFDFIGASKISLGVFENNKAAVNCYLSCGFRIVQRETVERYRCMNETWNCIEMELCK